MLEYVCRFFGGACGFLGMQAGFRQPMRVFGSVRGFFGNACWFIIMHPGFWLSMRSFQYACGFRAVQMRIWHCIGICENASGLLGVLSGF